MPTRYKYDPAKSMSTTALILAIASIICIFTPALAMALAPLGIIVALLSREADCKLNTRAMASIIICAIVFFLSIILVIFSLLFLISQAGGVDKLYDFLMERMMLYQ